MIDELLRQLSETPVLDWVATVLSLGYVILAARDNNWCWPLAIAGTLIWAHQMFVLYGLPSDSLLQLFYCVMAGVGWYRWRKVGRTRQQPGMLDELAIARTENADRRVERMSIGEHAAVIFGTLTLGYGLAMFAIAYRSYVLLPYWDGFTTAASLLATFLLVYRRLENWLYFIVIDVAYLYIYLQAGAYTYLLIMLAYIIVAVYGYRSWRARLTVEGSYERAT